MGGTIPIPCILILTALVFSFQPCHSMKIVVMDGLAKWKAPTIHVEDSLVFEHLQNLYLFHNRRAFDLCIFDGATLVSQGDSNSTHFTWQPLHPGHYYFSTRDRYRRSCEEGEKVPVRVIIPDLSPVLPPLPAPPPTAGGDHPAFPSPSWVPSSPSLVPEASPLQPTAPSPVSAASGSGIPFINSSPAVPLPTGETDTATIRPLPTPGDEGQVVGLGSSHPIQTAIMVASVIMSSALGLWL